MPISRDNRFVLSGTEVFHSRCASRIEHSIGNSNIQLIHSLRADLERAERSVAQLRERADYAETRIVRAEHALTESDHRRDDAIREAALHRLLRGSPIAMASTTPAAETRDDRDDTVIRFSLLEIE